MKFILENMFLFFNLENKSLKLPKVAYVFNACKKVMMFNDSFNICNEIDA